MIRALVLAVCSFAGGFAQPPHLCDVRAMGAAGDGKTLDTGAIQRAIDGCASSGEGRCTSHPAGIFPARCC